MGTNADVEEKVVADALAANNYDEKNQPSSTSPSRDDETPEEPTYDTGTLAWLQVLGSFFLFFNSW